MTTHSSNLAWGIPMDRGAWQATVHEVTESDTTERLSTAQHLSKDSWDTCAQRYFMNKSDRDYVSWYTNILKSYSKLFHFV